MQLVNKILKEKSKKQRTPDKDRNSLKPIHKCNKRILFLLNLPSEAYSSELARLGSDHVCIKKGN